MVLTFMPSYFNTPATQMKGPYDINTSTKLFKDTSFINNSSVSFQGFLYFNKLQKTGLTTSCSSTDKTLPNCDTGRYSLCSCSSSSDCSACAHKGYITVVNINDICTLEVLGAPDGTRQGKAAVQFTVKTQSPGDLVDNSNNRVNPELHKADDIYIETFVLPPLPFQKWVMITISREGRRFDFYYNDQLVLSKQTSTVLYIPPPIPTNISVGDPSLNGSSGYFNLYSTIQSASEIASQYTSFVTTRGSPMFDTNPLGDSLDNTSGGLKLPSLCSLDKNPNGPINPPALPYYEWSSSYA